MRMNVLGKHVNFFTVGHVRFGCIGLFVGFGSGWEHHLIVSE